MRACKTLEALATNKWPTLTIAYTAHRGQGTMLSWTNIMIHWACSNREINPGSKKQSLKIKPSPKQKEAQGLSQETS